jgi:hypothetical protein
MAFDERKPHSELPEAALMMLRDMKADRFTAWGRLRTAQDLVDRHLRFFCFAIDSRLGYAEISELLAQFGIVSQDGAPFAKGSLSSAVSRSHKRNTKFGLRRDITQAPAASHGNTLQLPATGGKSLQEPARNSGRLHMAAVGSTEMQHAAATCSDLLPEMSKTRAQLDPLALSQSDICGRQEPLATNNFKPSAQTLHSAADLLNNLETDNDH